MLRSKVGMKQMNVIVAGIVPDLGDRLICPNPVSVYEEQLRSHPCQFQRGSTSDPISGAGD